ncbi:MAG: cell division ATP-binding protein FtsE [Firmicutes bacterium RBG_13_65_8]|nr:MAG: cell division ATP-binding protein FtsE [Firmicutes bacterium RBG_13_65_8]
MIEFHEVTKVFGGHIRALSDVDLFIGKGEFVFVVGPSGAGKSTLLSLIYREDLPTSGFVVVDGRNLNSLRRPSVPYLRRGIGVVFQDYRLLPRKTVWENVAFALEVTGAGKAETRKRVVHVLELVGLRSRQRNYPNELSGGEQQRTCLARALVNSPKILLADEPTGNLDPEAGLNLMHRLADISVLGTTVVIATHAKPIVDLFRARVVRLERGRVVSDALRAGYDGPISAGGNA